MKGLTSAQVVASRQEFGTNTLTPPEKDPWWKEFLEKFTDPIIVILLVALALSIGIASYHYFDNGAEFTVFLEPIGVLLAILLATIVGFIFEQSANKKFEILNKVNDDTPVKVYRDDKICQISKSDVVVHDTVIIETGDEIPADGELIEAIALVVDESSLTGEPSCNKTIMEKDFKQDATYPSNYVLRGTKVLIGHGVVEIKHVGDATECGKVFIGAQIDNSIITPLNEQLNKLAEFITNTSYILAILIIIGRMAWWVSSLNVGQFDWIMFAGYLLNTIMIAVTIVVVAVPEGLPMSVTLSLALSMKRMLSTNNLVRKMHACETMGATTIICTDKTGTLTQNRMKVVDLCVLNNLEESNLNLINESFACNSTAYLEEKTDGKIEVLGNPTEGALLLYLHEQNINYLKIRESCAILNQLPFSTERKFMVTIVRRGAADNRVVVYVKGAPEVMIDMCRIEDDNLKRIKQNLVEYQEKAMRTLGFAYKVLDDYNDQAEIDFEFVCKDLELIGVIGILDPVRIDVPGAVGECLKAGIGIKIVTGDTPGTAKEIGRQIGLWMKDEPEAHHMSGLTFGLMSDDDALEIVEKLKILSRAKPLDKQRLVELLQRRNHVVAVTGDGTNDAPALNAAQVGLSMGDGTMVAKEASDITILDNSFYSITRAVMWGRSLYQNIQRFILFQMTINVAACIIVLLGAMIGSDSPLTVTQMLWVNLIMDTFAALALASLPPNMMVMSDKPRKREDNILNILMRKRILGVGILFVIVLFGILQYFRHSNIASLTDFNVYDFFKQYFVFERANGLSPYELSLFFSIFVMLQFWNLFNAKAFQSGSSAFKGLTQSVGFFSIAVVILIGQYVIVTYGGKMFNVTPLRLLDWFIIVSSTSVVLWIGEISRYFKNRVISRN